MSAAHRTSSFETSPQSRRAWMKEMGLCGTTLASGLTLGLGPAEILQQARADELQRLNRFPAMMQRYYERHVEGTIRRMDHVKDALDSKKSAEDYVTQVQGKIMRSFGPLPEKTPLKPRITAKVDRGAYRIENLIFESRPGFLVTANLYVPQNRKYPLPGVVGTCGHSVNGKAAESYQAFAQGLARQGYVVLLYDPIGQGERLQYPDEHLHSTVGASVREHIHGGNQQYLVGEFFGTWRAWDGIRALDYLLTREEVDPKHLGVTGNSGGGTMTTWLCGVERRWTMAAPSCFVTSFQNNLENELPADTEQCPPNCLALGLDHEDFIAAMAPKPVILLAKELDYFDVRGTLEAYERLKRLYGLLGAEENISMFVGQSYHGYSQENREAMYRWFNQATGVSDALAEPELTIEKDETLWATPRGQVAPEGSRPIYEFTQEKSQQMARQRKAATGDRLIEEVRRAMRLPPRLPEVSYRILRFRAGRQYPTDHAVTYAVASEPGIEVPVVMLSKEKLMSRPHGDETDCILYVSHHSADQELRDEPLVQELLKAQPDRHFLACDVRGIGDSQPNTCGGSETFLTPYGNDYFYSAYGIMLGRPYLAQRTLDVLQVLAWLKEVGYCQVHLVGKGWGTLPATFASLLSENVTQVTLKHPLTSYEAVAEAADYHWPLATLLPGVLARFDLPQCYAALKPKKLRQIEPWGAMADEG